MFEELNFEYMFSFVFAFRVYFKYISEIVNVFFFFLEWHCQKQKLRFMSKIPRTYFSHHYDF